MILIASREEADILKQLRALGAIDSAASLTKEVLLLKRQISELEITKAQKEEDFAKQERELRHMIGLEKKRQEMEIAHAKRDTELTVREGNLQADTKRFEEQLKFNTERFETMERYLKDMLSDILKRLPNVSLRIQEGAK